MGAELGLKPIQSLQNIAVINGKPSVYGDSLLALVQTNPLYEYVHESFDEETMAATCCVKRKNQKEYVATFSQKDAQRAGLWNKPGPWTQYPKRMLQMRARGFALRDKFADALNGLITAEEAMDYPVDVTPQSESVTQDLSVKLDNILLQREQSREEVAIENTNQQNLIEGSLDLAQLVIKHDVPLEIVSKWCKKAQVKKVEDLPEDLKLNCAEFVKTKYPLTKEI